MNWNHVCIIPALTLLLAASAAAAQSAAPDPGAHRDHARPAAQQIAAFRSQMCAERQARSVGRMAYIQARLDLTPAQQPLFQTWKAAIESRQDARAANCTKPREAHQPLTLPQREARIEQALKTRLDALEKTRPATEALYAALTPEQQKLFAMHDHPRLAMHRGFGGRGFEGRGGLGLQG